MFGNKNSPPAVEPPEYRLVWVVMAAAAILNVVYIATPPVGKSHLNIITFCAFVVTMIIGNVRILMRKWHAHLVVQVEGGCAGIIVGLVAQVIVLGALWPLLECASAATWLWQRGRTGGKVNTQQF